MKIRNHLIHGRFEAKQGKGNRFHVWLDDGTQASLNGGNIDEAGTREALGFGFLYDTKCTAYWEGSDIEELKMSVKSYRFTLANELTATDNSEATKQSLINQYFSKTASKTWSYSVREGKSLTIYIMNADEFRTFLNLWSTMEHNGTKAGVTTYKLRGKRCEKEIVRWLNERAGE